MTLTRLSRLLAIWATAIITVILLCREPLRQSAEASGTTNFQPAVSRSLHIPAASATHDSIFSWGCVESRDYPTFIANLRKIGCPEETIRDILLTDLLENSARHAKDSSSIWSSLLSNYPNQTVAHETAVLAKALLGSSSLDLSEPKGQQIQDNEVKMSNDPSALARVDSEYGAQSAATWRRIGTNQPTEADLNTLRNIQMNRSVALKELLSEAELERYEAAASGTLTDTLNTYAELNLSESEALQLIKLKQSQTDTRAALNCQNLLEESIDQSSIRALLGESRYALYEQQQDPDYIRLHLFAESEQIPPEKITQIYQKFHSTLSPSTSYTLTETIADQIGVEVSQRWARLMERSQAFTSLSAESGNDSAP